MLLHEEIYPYPGYHEREHAASARCRVRVFEIAGPELIIVFSELTGALAHLGENHGTSITNRAEVLATAWRRRYHLEEVDVTFVEHYPARGYAYQRHGVTIWQSKETFDQLHVAWNARRAAYTKAQWSHVGRARVEAMIGEAWPEPAGVTEETLQQRGQA